MPLTWFRLCDRRWACLFSASGARLFRMEHGGRFAAGSHEWEANRKFCLEPMRVNRKRLREMFVDGSCGIGIRLSVNSLSFDPGGTPANRTPRTRRSFVTPAELWVRTVYEFAASYQKSVINRDHIIQALAPLFRGRVFTFLIENRNASANDVENNIEGLCLEFERLKPYLLQMWKSRE